MFIVMTLNFKKLLFRNLDLKSHTEKDDNGSDPKNLKN
jgi:hypothetical protein